MSTLIEAGEWSWFADRCLEMFIVFFLLGHSFHFASKLFELRVKQCHSTNGVFIQLFHVLCRIYQKIFARRKDDSNFSFLIKLNNFISFQVTLVFRYGLENLQINYIWINFGMKINNIWLMLDLVFECHPSGTVVFHVSSVWFMACTFSQFCLHFFLLLSFPFVKVLFNPQLHVQVILFFVVL